MDIIADALNTIKTHKKVGKGECQIRRSSKLLLSVLDILIEKGYIEKYEVIENGRGNLINVQGIGPINNCGAIKPRFAIGANEWVNWEERYILSKDFGHIVVSTSRGLMTNVEAREKQLGGRLIAYVY
jgi:small subunit ribosomal protein S8